MFIQHTSNYELTVIIALAITLIVQLWTIVIFNKNKSRWRSYDVAIVAVLFECLLRNIAVGVYVALQKVEAAHRPAFDYCDLFAWTFNSSHTFHASCLATLSVIAVFSIKLHGKDECLRQYLTTTHLVYHLFCLTTLCACVGVAAILAKPERYAFTASFTDAARTQCDVLPHQLDIKYNAFIVILHTFLAAIGVVSTCYACVLYMRVRRRRGFEYRRKKQSTSDLSVDNNNRHYYDTYTIHRGGGGYDVGTMWRSDFSQVSTTVSSTNSRRPLHGGATTAQPPNNKDEYKGTGLETINPVLIVCYLFYHFPLIILSIFPTLVTPWPVSNFFLWLGLLQDILIPVSLGIVDARFNTWVSHVYRCSHRRRHVEGKLPHMGLDGKFRHFSSSQPQSLEINQMHPLRCYQASNNKQGENVEIHHKFPITNGSLYTSIDGRVPVIHNYRRHHHHQLYNENQHHAGANLNLHSANLQRPQPRTQYYTTHSHQDNTLNIPPSHSVIKPYLKHVSLSQNSLRQMPLGDDEQVAKIIATQPKLSEEEDEYNEYDSSSSSFSITTEANGDFEFFHRNGSIKEDKSYNEFKIKRSNSKRSLENLQAYIDEDYLSHSDSLMQLSASAGKSLSAEFLHAAHFCAGGSVPDLKKIFISEYL